MKTLEWQRFLETQRTRHGKTIFCVTELVNAARTTTAAIHVELQRLVQRGVIGQTVAHRLKPDRIERAVSAWAPVRSIPRRQ